MSEAVRAIRKQRNGNVRTEQRIPQNVHSFECHG